MSLVPASFNFTTYKTATFTEAVTLLSGGPGSTPQDLTNYTAQMTIKDQQAGKVLFTMSTTISPSGSGIVIGGNQGSIYLSIVQSDIDAFTFKRSFYDITISRNGITDILLFGNFNVVTL